MRLYGSLNNYIEMHRKRCALSQDELAVLMAVEGGKAVSHLELGDRPATLEGVLALEMIFEEPAQRIFAGIAESVREDLAARAAMLLESTSDARPNQRLAKKLEVLARLARENDVQFIPTWEEES